MRWLGEGGRVVEWDRGNGWWISSMTLRRYESEKYSYRVPDQAEKMSVSSHMHAKLILELGACHL